MPVNIGTGEQFKPEFLAISPNNRMPAIVDHAPADGGAAGRVFESGAILLYLAEKTGQFIPADLRGRVEALQWLFWQMGGLGPMAGQNHHFASTRRRRSPTPSTATCNETSRLYGVLEQAPGRPRRSSPGEYTIADMASYPVDRAARAAGPEARRLPAPQALVRSDAEARPATIRAYERGKALNMGPR